MESKVVTITPDEARLYLKNNPSNRNIRQSQVDAIAKDMLEGRWKVTHQGIAIGKTGRLIDGQHRLSAIVKANIPVKMMVTFDAEEEDVEVIDTGRNRSVRDVFVFEGLSGWMKSSLCIAVARFFVTRNKNRKVSASDVKAEMMKNEDSYRTLYQILNLNRRGNRMSNKSINAAIVSAYKNGVPETDLIAFVDLINSDRLPSGRYNSQIVLKFKTFIANNKLKKITIDPNDMYKLTSNVIYNFVKNTNSIMLKVPETERYVW